MLRLTRLLCVVCSTSSDPYRVLGVTQDMPFAEIRQKFHELTQRYHPDMSSGDANRFREINSAYRELRAIYRRRQTPTVSDGDGATDAKSRDHYWHRHRTTNTSRAHAQKEEAYRRWSQRSSDENARRDESAYCEGSGRHTRLRWSIFHNFFDGYEILLSLFAVFVVLVYSVQRYFVVLHLVAEKRKRVRNMEEGLPPPMPLEVKEEDREKYKEPVRDSDLRSDSQRLREEMYYRRATQRRFDDMREFLFVYDPDGVGDCTVSTSRFSHQYVDERRIARRCPIVREFNSEKRDQSYDTIAKELRATMEKTPWWNARAGRYGGLIAQGLTCVPVNSTATAKWTFIEYAPLTTAAAAAAGTGATMAAPHTTKPKDDGAAAHSSSPWGSDSSIEMPSFSSAVSPNSVPREPPVCLAALRNLRFDDIGMCQRVVGTEHVAHSPKRTTSSASAQARQPAAADTWTSDAKHNCSSASTINTPNGTRLDPAPLPAARGGALVRGGPLPLCNTSVPLEKMKL